MSKTVKLDDQVHSELEELRLKKETFSATVARLINFHREITRAVWSSAGEPPKSPSSGV